MFDRLRTWLLRILRVPPQPEPPFGDPASTKIFRASPKFYSLRLLGWGVGQFFALVGLVVGVIILLAVEHKVYELRNQAGNEVSVSAQPGNPVSENQSKATKKARHSAGFKQVVNDIAALLVKVPVGLFLLIWGLKLLGLLFYGAQLVLTYAALRLDYEMRWYVVTDRSLRIRTGIWKVQELTMSFANLQQVVLSQGPIQRLLGIADVQVQSAGGGGGGTAQHGHRAENLSLHIGYFHGVDNATEVRDLILTRLRHFRETGLGDPDELKHAATSKTTKPIAGVVIGESSALVAARELLAETRQLRAAVQARN
jgi:membrane protein YdbS with pleckstrin-like domain